MQSNSKSLDLLGYVRFVLALAVTAFHLWTPAFPDAGRHSVAGFFCLSGFLMTLIANEVYRDRPAAFIGNRVLRLYPTYLVCLAMVYAICSLFPVPPQSPPVYIPMPTQGSDWFKQLSLVSSANFAVGPMGGRVLTTAWSLEIEVIFYAVIGLCTYRSLFLTTLGFIVSLTVALLGLFHVVPVQFYWSVLGTGFFFFGGSLAYFAGKQLRLGRAAWPVVASAGGVFCLATFALPFTSALEDYGGVRPHLYLLISGGAMVVLLTALSTIRGPVVSMPGAAFLGKMSYPIFLLHKGIAVPVVEFNGVGNPFATFAISLPFTLAISALVVCAVETPVERLRQRLRRGRMLSVCVDSDSPSSAPLTQHAA